MGILTVASFLWRFWQCGGPPCSTGPWSTSVIYDHTTVAAWGFVVDVGALGSETLVARAGRAWFGGDMSNCCMSFYRGKQFSGNTQPLSLYHCWTGSPLEVPRYTPSIALIENVCGKIKSLILFAIVLLSGRTETEWPCEKNRTEVEKVWLSSYKKSLDFLMTEWSAVYPSCLADSKAAKTISSTPLRGCSAPGGVCIFGQTGCGKVSLLRGVPSGPSPISYLKNGTWDGVRALSAPVLPSDRGLGSPFSRTK